jgi:hypothetical protein
VTAAASRLLSPPRMRLYLRALTLPLALALFWLLAARNGLGGDFFYDEAVYANLADHPFRSDYYFDPIFFRNPPFVYLFYYALERVLPGAPRELTFRAASLAFSSLGLIFLWLTLRRALGSPLLVAVSLIGLAASSLFVRYAISATMYPFAFCFLCLALYGIAVDDARWRTLGFVLVVYTHYWGHVIFAAYLAALRLRGTPLRRALGENALVLLAFVPLALVTLVGGIYHASNLRPGTRGLTALAFYLPSPLWLGGASAAIVTFVERSWARRSALELLALAAMALFTAISLVAKLSDRYLFFFMPIYLIGGGFGLEELCARVGGRGARVLVAALAALYALPAQLLRRAEPALFVDHHADNNRFQSWRPAVAACGDARVLTNNARSFVYYLSRADGERHRLEELEASGRVYQFDAVTDLLGEYRRRPAGCIAIDRPRYFPEIAEAVAALPGCAPVEAGPLRLFKCR